MFKINEIVISNTTPLTTNVIWVKPVSFGLYKLLVYTDSGWTSVSPDESKQALINASTEYNTLHSIETLTLQQAVDKVPDADKGLGKMITYYDGTTWQFRQFIGTNVSTWSNSANWIAVSTASIDYSGFPLFNVTTSVPLSAGQYYTAITARAAVPVNVRKRGLEILYETAAGIWYSERFIGADVAAWTTAGNWVQMPDKTYVDTQDTTLFSELSRLDRYLQKIVIDEEVILTPTKIGEDANWEMTTSIFSGWGESVGILPSNINAFSFKVRARAIAITIIRFTIYENSPLGSILTDVTKDVNIAPNTEANVVIKLPAMFDNSSNKQCFAMWRCNQLCDLWRANGSTYPYLIPTYTGVYYSTNGNLSEATLSTSDYVWPLTYGTYERIFELINQPTVDKLDEIVSQMTQGGDDITTPTIFGTENGTWQNAVSTFSGWGEIFGTGTDFNAVAVMVRARSTNTSPITTILVRIRKGSGGKNGEVITTGTVTGLNIIAGGIQKIIVKLNNTVSNPNGDLLWIEYLCDQFLDRYEPTRFTYPYTPADGVTYPKFAYAVKGVMQSTLNEVIGTSNHPFTVWYGTYEKYYELTDEQVENIGQRLQIPDPSSETVGISLPDTLTAVVGDTLQLFFRGMLKAVNPYNYDLLVTCSKGNKYPRYFQFTPSVADIGDVDFKIQAKNNDGKILGEATSKLKIRNVVSAPASVLNVCCFGDSLTSTGAWCAEADRRLTGTGGTPIGLALSNIKFCGSKLNGTTGYFGVGGWNWPDYTTRGRAAFRFQVSGVTTVSVGAVYSNNGYQYTVDEVNVTTGVGNILCNAVSFSQLPSLSGTLTKVSGNGDATITFSSWEENSQNPLWNQTTNQMDFVPYANTYCNRHIDVVYTLLSWNGQTPWRTDFTDIINQVKIFADTLHRDFPNAKMKILGIQVPSINGGMGANYVATGTSYADGFGMVITALNQNKAYQDFANLTAYKDWVEFVNISAQFDSENNMPESDTKVNTRSSKTEKIGNNGVHPATEGYYQIADAVFRNFISNFCQ